MNRSTLIGATAGAIAATAVAGIAGYQIVKTSGYAEVVSVRPVTMPQVDCRDEQVTRTAPTKDPHQIAGTVAGAVVGGVVGHQFGSGSGKDVATAAGAVAGGYAGNKVQEKMQAGNTYTTSERHCVTVGQTITGYDVTYRLEGRQGVVRMDYDPGSRIPVKDGELVTTRGKS
jgi:uncharacterized protein YcfJ